jgi:hypothetical protein
VANQKFWERQWDLTANLPSTWFVAADGLLAAAEVLYSAWRKVRPKRVRGPVPKHYRLLGPILLLRAASVETLLKGRAVSRGHRFVVGGRFTPIPKSGNGHDLPRLADATNFQLTKEERDLLTRLSPRLELSRYPIAKSWRTGLLPHSSNDYLMDLSYDSTDEQVLRRVLKRLRRGVAW